MKSSREPDRPEPPPEHESGVRSLVAGARGESYVSLPSLAAAREHSDAVVILEGDFGGQIYVVAPVNLVECDEAALQDLLAELDALEWQEPEGARVFFERHKMGAGVQGGMGGAVVKQEMWVHERLKGWSISIAEFLAGKAVRLHK